MATTLQEGDSGELVKRLQATLISYGYDLDPTDANGDFGDRTKAAVESFQDKRGLPTTGMADPQTIAAMDLDPDTLKDLIEIEHGGPISTRSSGFLWAERVRWNGIFRLTFEQGRSQSDVERWLWSGAPPAGTRLEYTPKMDVEEFGLTGVVGDVAKELTPTAYMELSTAEPTSYQDHLLDAAERERLLDTPVSWLGGNVTWRQLWADPGPWRGLREIDGNLVWVGPDESDGNMSLQVYPMGSEHFNRNVRWFIDQQGDSLGMAVKHEEEHEWEILKLVVIGFGGAGHP